MINGNIKILLSSIYSKNFNLSKLHFCYLSIRLVKNIRFLDKPRMLRINILFADLNNRVKRMHCSVVSECSGEVSFLK